MQEDKNRPDETQSRNIDEILRERERLDQILQERFKKEVTILFTDICGYTEYIDKRGDISGRAMLQKHNDLVLPLVEKHQGAVIKTIGDAVMASFSTPLAAVKAAMAIQHGLHEHNQKTEAVDRIHVKMGLNMGDVLIDGIDAHGDVVNVASRIQSQAGKDEILISSNVYDQVRGSEDILCRFRGTVQVKGKAEPLELYRVVWQDEAISVSAAPSVRGGEVAEDLVRPPIKVLQLEITREADRLKISAHEQSAGEVSTIRHYDEMPIHVERIEAHCREIVESLNNANRNGQLTRKVLMRLREVGREFHDELFTADVQEKIERAEADHLVLNLDDGLVHVPWELLHDGKQFLCQRFNMGRLVKTKQTILNSKTRVLARPLKMLILADPRGDLKGAYDEGAQIRDYADRHTELISASLRSDDITPKFIREKMRNFDLVHFAGHADYHQQNPSKSGWRLTSGVITADEITGMAGTATMPALIFSNACQSARTEEWRISQNFHDEIFGLANAFTLAGVKHYVGTFWEIMDEPSSRFAMEFYRNLFSGVTIGEAMRMSRTELIKTYGEETIVWASYLLYGDPTSNYMAQVKRAEARELLDKPLPVHVPSPDRREERVRAREEVIDVAQKEARPKKWTWLGVAAGLLLLATILLWGYPGILKEDTAKYESAAVAYYNDGNFKEALNTCNILEDKNSQLRVIYLIRGNINLRNGKIDLAETAYNKALQAEKGTDLQKAEAFIGLGRIASIQKQFDVALSRYQQATDLAPESSVGYLSQAIILENGKNYDAALGLLKKAQKLAPENHVIAAISSETQKKLALNRDQEKQERVGQLVKELLASMDSPTRALPSDGWTSLPLTLWIMDFEAQGYSLQEGEERLLGSGIADQVLQHGRLQVVERTLLDKLLEELKLGTSELIDRRTALSLGRIMAARLILSGQVLYSGPQTQVSMRLIETETGRIPAAINESFGSAVPASVLAQRLSGNLLEKLERLYPLRGKISEVTGEEVGLNIGDACGTKVGERFKVIETGSVLEITEIQRDTSLAKIIDGDEGITTGLRIESLAESKPN
jgi:class 3 adenylate cyclase/tetratricopeptide (TPR) repeat protein